MAIVLISSELPEIMGLSDEIIVMHEGRIVRRFARGEASAEMIVGAAIANEDSAPPRGADAVVGALP